MRAAYWTLWLGFWLCLGCAVLTLSARAPLPVRLLITTLCALAPAAVMLLFSTSAFSAIDALSMLSGGLAATRATMQAMIAMFLGLLSASLQMETRRLTTAAVGAALIAAGAPFFGLRFGGWPGVAVGFAVSALLQLTPGRLRAFG